MGSRVRDTADDEQQRAARDPRRILERHGCDGGSDRSIHAPVGWKGVGPRGDRQQLLANPDLDEIQLLNSRNRESQALGVSLFARMASRGFFFSFFEEFRETDHACCASSLTQTIADDADGRRGTAVPSVSLL